jgi:hypothetical protein
MPAEPSNLPFKRCSKCGDLWLRTSDFLADPMVVFVGYQASWEQLFGLFLFNHVRCGTTLSVPQTAFASLSPKPELADSGDLLAAQREFCLARKDDKPCPPKCACEYVSHIAHLAVTWPKKPLV